MIIIDLNGNWILNEAGKEDNYPATVPGCVHTDLLSAGVIKDPFFSTNELDAQWIGEKDWVYRREFQVNAAFLSAKRKILVCEGIDTVASLRINGTHIGDTENMFRRHTFDISPMLRKGLNTLEVMFTSPMKSGLERSLKIPYEVPGSEYHWGFEHDNITHRNQLRKAQYQYGWDWAPCLPSAGIWKDIYIQGCDTAYIEHLACSQSFEGGTAILEVEAHINSSAGTEIGLEAVLSGPDKTQAASACKKFQIADDCHKHTLALTVSNPDLWNPNGYGKQPLYTLELKLRKGTDTIDIKKCRIGLRKLRLIHGKGANGGDFHFEINGNAVFAKGANWVPADTFPARVSQEKYSFLLRSAADANMNMLRVWGGGIYESEKFYDLCDELGILVWQDFLFACCAYPATKDFLDNVDAEVRHQIRRLKHHACLAIWCGNNENEGVARVWGRSKSHTELLEKDYAALQQVLAKACAEEDSSRTYWPASPHVDETGAGDTHDWNIGYNREPFANYRKVVSDFASEFGFSSFPSMATVQGMVLPEDRNPSSMPFEYHQRKKDLNGILMDYLCTNFRLPSNMEVIILLTQINQALAMKAAVEHFRRKKPDTMGALYWQYNDCWPAVSWAGIDYLSRWKAVHYFARRFFSPLLLSILDKADTVEIHLTNDLPHQVKGRFVVQVWQTDGQLLEETTHEFHIGADGNLKSAEIPIKHIFRHGNRKTNTVLHVKTLNCIYSSENIHFFAPFKYLELEDPEIQLSMDNDSGLFIKASRPAFFVVLKMKDESQVPCDNFFHLFPGKKHHLPHIIKGICLTADINELKCMSLFNM